MTLLENAVSDLAGALEKLETKLEESLDGQMTDREAIAAARRSAKAARDHAGEASAGLGAAISASPAKTDRKTACSIWRPISTATSPRCPASLARSAMRG